MDEKKEWDKEVKTKVEDLLYPLIEWVKERIEKDRGAHGLMNLPAPGLDSI